MNVLQGTLTDRDSWSPARRCPIEKTMAVAGTRSAMLIMREAYYGTTRFDDFTRRVGVTRAAMSARLAELVTVGLLTRSMYREPGRRGREEYVLTDAGRDFMPVVWAMFQWGQQHLPEPAPLTLDHSACGAAAKVEIRCSRGHSIPPEELGVRMKPDLAQLVSTLEVTDCRGEFVG